MKIQQTIFRALSLAAGVAMLACSTWASADPPSRVARLGYATGTISFSPAGEGEWTQASINRPLTTGDRLWADSGARAEIEVGGAMLRMDSATYVSILNLDDQIVQLQLAQGTMNMRVRRVEPNQVFEIDTPNLAFTVRQPGDYRIEVDADGNATEIYVRRGQGDVYGDGASYRIDSRQPYRFTGTGLRDYQNIEAPRPDEFDRWASERDRGYETSASARYVSQDVVGYQDLDTHGTWRSDPSYGNVWIPSHVATDWAPYRDGHWAWVDPWGWTWIDDAPWGFAVSHYGRWTNMRGTWGWVPGPVRTRAYYAPALVAFVGGSNFQIAISSGNVGGVAWFPLGPREVYRPSYAVSRGYFERVNQTNTVVNTTVINNYYNNSNVTNVVYANRQVPGAVVAVPTTTFVQSAPVQRAAVRMTPTMVASAPVAAVPTIAPTQRSVFGAAAPSEKAPPARAHERAVVAHNAPPAPTVGFAAQQKQLDAKPGKPLEETARRELKPVAAAQAPVVKVVAAEKVEPKAIPPTATPGVPPMAATRPQTGTQAGPGQRVTPVTPTQPQVIPPTANAPAPEQRGKPEQRGEPRQQSVTAPPTSVARPASTPVTPPQATPSPAAPPVAMSPPQDQRAKPEQRGKPEPQGKPEQQGKTDQRDEPRGTPPSRVATVPPAQPQTVTPAAPMQRAVPVPPEKAQAAPPAQRAVPTPPAQPQAVPPPASVARSAPPPAQAPAATPPAPVSRIAPSPPQQQGPPPAQMSRAAPPPAQPQAVPASPPTQRAVPTPPVAPQPAPPTTAARAQPPAAQAPPPAQAKGQPGTGKPDDKKRDADEAKREEELRKQQKG